MKRKRREFRSREFMDEFWEPIFARYGGEAKWAAEAGVRVDRDPVTGSRVFVDIRPKEGRTGGMSDENKTIYPANPTPVPGEADLPTAPEGHPGQAAEVSEQERDEAAGMAPAADDGEPNGSENDEPEDETESD